MTDKLWIPPMSDHLIKKGWWDSHQEIGEPHTSKQLEDWFNTNHKCIKCGKIIRSHQQAQEDCIGNQ